MYVPMVGNQKTGALPRPNKPLSLLQQTGKPESLSCDLSYSCVKCETMQQQKAFDPTPDH